MEELKTSITQYNDQLSMVSEALSATQDINERESLLALQSELQELIQLTQESLNAVLAKEEANHSTLELPQNDSNENNEKTELDDEYALFMQEMAKSGAYEENKPECSKDVTNDENGSDSDIEDELATLQGMKCAVYHTHKWGGQPSLHNAMVSEVIPHQDDDQFKDLQVRVLFTHPTHAEMLPCPFFLDGQCRFEDDQCRYSHGDVVPLSDLKDAILPNFEAVKIGSTVLLKLKSADDEDTSLTKKSSEKYHLWHRAIVKSIDLEKKTCIAKLEHGVHTGEKRKSGTDEVFVKFEEIFPLNADSVDSSDSEDSISDTEYPESKALRPSTAQAQEVHALLVERSLQQGGPALGEWERHTRGIGSKLMLAMGYVPGAGLGAAGAGRVQPVLARACPVGKSLDHCMEISERNAARDPLEVEQKLKRLQKREEERHKRAYERAKEKERRNVFNFLNRTLGDAPDEQEASSSADIKQSSSKDLNIEQFKITEDLKRLEREVVKLNSSLVKYPSGSNGHRSITMQIIERNKELNALKSKEKQIFREQSHRKDKQKMTVF